MPKARYPLSQAFMSRNGTLNSVDAFVLNGMMDKYQDKIYVIKRPGTQNFVSIDTGGHNPQGAFYFNGFIYEIANDILYRTSGTLNSGSSLHTFSQSAVPTWYKRSDNAAVVFQDRLWIIGVGDQPGTTATGEVWSTQDGVTWALMTSGAGAERLGQRVVVFNGQMWMIAGRKASTAAALQDVDVTSDGVTWTEVIGIAPWGAREHFGLIAANNNMYIFGGDDNTGVYYNDVWTSSDGLNWIKISSGAAWSPRTNFGFAFFNNQFVIAGGLNAATAYNEVWASPDGILWTLQTASAFSVPRFGNQLVVYNGKLYSIGGFNAVTTSLDDIYVTTDLVTWTLVTSSPGFVARGNASVAVFKTPTSVSPFHYESVWVMAGLNNALGDQKDVWYGNLDTQTLMTYNLNPTIFGQPYQFATFLNGTKLLIKNQSNFWSLSAGTLVEVTDPNYPPATVPGISVLNAFAYVTTPEGEIHGCQIDNPLTWPALQFTTADYEDDPAIATKKYLNYVVVFGQYTIQFFYDNANPPPGISISPYTGANLRIGCAFAGTLQELQNTLIWVGQTINRNWGVYIFNGMSPQKISVSWVDKVINEHLDGNTTCFVFGAEGHTYYVLNFVSASASLVYDFDMKQWYVWTALFDTTQTALPYAFALTTFTAGEFDLLVGTGNFAGQIFSTSETFLQDAAGFFKLMVQTDKVDGGTLQRKFQGNCDIVGDTSPALVQLSWSDDDYQSWTTPVNIDMDNMRPRRNRLGSFRRRAYRLSQTDNNPARWEALELTFSATEVE